MGEQSGQYFRDIIENVDISIAEHRLIYNSEGQAVDYEFIYVNDAFCRSLRKTKENVLSKTVKEVFPNIEDAWINRYAIIVKEQKKDSFTMFSESMDKYFKVNAYASGEDTFVAVFYSPLSNSSEPKIEKDHIPVMAMMEYDMVTKTYRNMQNVKDLIGVEIRTHEDFVLFRNENTHPNDRIKLKELNEAIRKDVQSKKVLTIRVFHEVLKRYVWIEFTVFFNKVLDGNSNAVTIYGKNVDFEVEQIHATEVISRLFERTKKIANIATFLYDIKNDVFNESSDLNEFLGVEHIKRIADFRNIVLKEDLQRFDHATKEILNTSEGLVNRYRIHKYGSTHYIESYLYGQEDEEGNIIRVFGILNDRTIEENQKRIAENAKNSFERVFNLSPSGMFAVNEQFEITLKNDKFKEYLEYDRLYHELSELLKHDFDHYQTMLEDGRPIENAEVEIRMNQKSRYYHISINPILGEFKNKYLGSVVDMTDIVRKTKEIEYLSTHDMLTSLYNRHSFDEMILSLDTEDKHGVIVCDIDGLKLMNDAFGHLDGDKLLIRFSEKLKDIIHNGFIARIGGDEFGVILKNTTSQELEKICSEIVKANEKLGLYEVDFSVSIGYSIVNENQMFFDAFKEAENKMYRMKLKQRGNRKYRALQSILSALDERSAFHKPHRLQVAKYAKEIMRHAGFKRTRDLEEVEQVGLLHDIGQIVINQTILERTGPLTKEELKIIQYHSESGYKIVSNIIDNEMIGLSVLYHHENYDGSGYPHGIKSNQIPFYSRVIRIADSYDIMTRVDGYKKIMTPKEAVEELVTLKGIHYDPELVDAFTKYLKKEGII